MDSFENINDHLVYIKAKSRTEAVGLKNDAKGVTATGKSLVIFFDDRYHLHLAPGQDPYQIRREIENFLNPNPDSEDSEGESKNTVTRDAKGKFVSKPKSTDNKTGAPEANPSLQTEPPKKKGFWDSLK